MCVVRTLNRIPFDNPTADRRHQRAVPGCTPTSGDPLRTTGWRGDRKKPNTDTAEPGVRSPANPGAGPVRETTLTISRKPETAVLARRPRASGRSYASASRGTPTRRRDPSVACCLMSAAFPAAAAPIGSKSVARAPSADHPSHACASRSVHAGNNARVRRAADERLCRWWRGGSHNPSVPARHQQRSTTHATRASPCRAPP